MRKLLPGQVTNRSLKHGLNKQIKWTKPLYMAPRKNGRSQQQKIDVPMVLESDILHDSVIFCGLQVFF